MIEAVPAAQGRRLDSRYTLLEKLGSGGQGEVWRVHDDTRGVDVALKILNPALSRNEAAWAALEREYSIASRLNNPAILKIFPPERSGDVVVLPMELAPGGDLRRLRGAGYLEIIPVLLEIAQALEHAHERGVVHRDLKPGNVLFDARGRVKLADFGVAGTVFAADGNLPSQGLSPFTASPEQLRGQPPTPADDIYGLGALAYELLSGYPPYYPHFDAKRAQSERVPDLVPTRQIPPLLGTLVMRMLEKKASDRPRTMREVIDELDAALNDTLTFDFETVIDPTTGTSTAASTAASAQPAPPPGQEAPATARESFSSAPRDSARRPQEQMAPPARTALPENTPEQSMPAQPSRSYRAVSHTAPPASSNQRAGSESAPSPHDRVTPTERPALPEHARDQPLPHP